MSNKQRVISFFLGIAIMLFASCSHGPNQEASGGGSSSLASRGQESEPGVSSDSLNPEISSEASADMSYGKTSSKAGKISSKNKPENNTGNILPETVSVWTADSLTDIFADTTEPSNARKSIQLDMAKNEYESAQIAIRSLDTLSNVKITFDNISKGMPELTARPIGYVRCSYSSGNGVFPGPSKYFRTALGGQSYPAEFPEFYENTNKLQTVEADTTVSFVIEAHASAKTAAGTYSANAVIATSEGIRKIPVRIAVYNVTLPNPSKSEFTYSCWTDSNTHADMIRQWYGTDLYTNDYWKIISRFAEYQKKQRQNSLWVPLTSLMQSDLTVAPDGTYQFSFKNFDKYIQTSLDSGDYKYIEGSHLLGKDWSGDFSALKENGPCTVEIYQGTGSKISKKTVLYSEPAAKKHLIQMLTALAKHVKQKGWDKVWLQHGLDECFDLETHIPEAVEIIHTVKKIMPFAKTVDAGSVYSVMKEYDMPCPRMDFYEVEKSKYDALNKSPDKNLWMYSDTGARGDIIFRGQDYPLISTRAVGWYSYINKFTGHLHWAWNLWDFYGLNPFTEMSAKDGPIDTYLVYPDMINMTVMESTRSTAVRDGFEDYELLRLAEGKNQKLTQKLMEDIVIDQSRFQRSSAEFAALRIKLLKLFK